MSSNKTDTNLLVAIESQYTAQPVFDADKKRIAIELQRRSKTETAAFSLNNSDPAVLQQVCQQLEHYQELYQSDVIIRVNPQLLQAKVVLALDPRRVILTLSGSVKAEKPLLAALSWYKKQGFRILVEDNSVSAYSESLLALADIIRLDMQVTSLDDVQRHQAMYGRPGLLWLADRVETQDQFSLYKSLGCSLFQGYFLPDKLEVGRKKIEPSAVKLADIIGCLFAAEPDLNQLAAVLQDEPGIVMGMLKVANSPLYRKAREVSSIKDVVTRLGLALSTKLVLTYAVLSGSDAPAAITVLTRAYTAQSIARHWQFDANQSQPFFLAALLSGSDMLFGVSTEVFLSHLSVSTQIEAALRQRSGPVAEALAMVMKIERGSALKLVPDTDELPYLTLYNTELSQVQQRLASI